MRKHILLSREANEFVGIEYSDEELLRSSVWADLFIYTRLAKRIALERQEEDGAA